MIAHANFYLSIFLVPSLSFIIFRLILPSCYLELGWEAPAFPFFWTLFCLHTLYLSQHLNTYSWYSLFRVKWGGGTFPSPIFFDYWKGGSPLVSPFANRVKVDSVKLIIGEFSSSFPVQFTCSYCFCNSSSEYFRVALSWLGHFLPFEASQSSPCDILLSRKEGNNVVWRSRLRGVSDPCFPPFQSLSDFGGIKENP